MRKLCFLIILASLLISVFSMSVRIKKVEGINGNWWDPAWSYRRKLNITENSGYDLTSFPVDVVFEHDGNVKADGTDIRVVDGSTEIPSYVEECNSTHAKVIFEVDLLALESKIVYIYYGNQYAIAPSYPLVSLTITEGNTGHAIIDNSIYIGWDYTSWGWSNNVELWNDFRIDFNENNDPTDDNDLIRDYGSRQGGIARHRLDLQAIGLGNYQAYVQTPIYVDIEFADAGLRVYRNHNWVETTQADHLFMFSTSWDYANFGLGSEQNIIDGKNVSQISPSPPWHYPWNEMYISPVNPRWMAYRDSLNGEIFGSIGLNIGIAYNYLFTAKEGSDWDRCIFYDFILDSPIEPYDQPIDCRIYWYGDNSNNYIEIEKTAAILNNQPTINIVKETITVPDDYPTIQEAINNANEGDTIFVRNGTYYENVAVNKTVSLIGENKDTTIIDGNWIGTVVTITADNVKISGFTVEKSGMSGSDSGIAIGGSNTIINDNIILSCYFGVRLDYNSNNTIAENIITNSREWGFGVSLWHSSSNRINKNEITKMSKGWGIYITYGSNNNNVTYNNLRDNWSNLYLDISTGNRIVGNNLSRLSPGGWKTLAVLEWGSNVFYHNNIEGPLDIYESVNVWDDGYPSGGNYWSDYAGIDLYSGPYQNEAGSDGIGDTPHIIDAYNQDNYPLMKPYPWGPHDIGVTSVRVSKTIVGQGYSMFINVMVFNYGNGTENINVTIYANTAIIGEINNITIADRSSIILTFTWNTTGFDKGNYTIWAYAWPVTGETDTNDNTLTSAIQVHVGVPGNVWGNMNPPPDYDGVCNARDITYLVLHFNEKPPNWNPNADINNDLIVNARDITIAVLNFMKTENDP